MLAIKPVVNVKSVVSLFSLILLPLFLVGCGGGGGSSSGVPAPTDLTVPTVTITGPSLHNGSSFMLTATFSEAVTGFEASDITAVGHAVAVSPESGSGTIFTLTVTPTNADLSLTIPASSATDGTNGNTASAEFTVTYDGVAPSYMSHRVANSQGTTLNGFAERFFFLLVLTYDEAVTRALIIPTGTSVATNPELLPTSDLATFNGDLDVVSISENNVASITVSPTTATGDVVVMFPEGFAEDLAGNKSAAREITLCRNDADGDGTCD